MSFRHCSKGSTAGMNTSNNPPSLHELGEQVQPPKNPKDGLRKIINSKSASSTSFYEVGPLSGLKRILPSRMGCSGLSGQERWSQGKEKKSL